MHCFLHLLKLHRKFTFNARRLFANNIYKMVCALCPFQIAPHTLKKWYKDFVKNDDHFSECITGRWEREWLLDQTDLKLKAIYFLNRFSDCKHTEAEEYLTIDVFQLYLNETLLPTLTVQELKGITWPISQ